MKDFHTFSGIELHFFTLEINEFKLVDLSHLTHPDLPILKAVQMSSAIPIFIAPVCVENECYVDGGFVCNYPLNQCIERVGNSDEILGLYDCDPELSSNGEVKESSTILDYTTIFINKVVNNVKLYVEPKEIPNQLSYIFEKMNFKSIQEAVNSREKRQQLFDSGVKAGKDYLDSRV
jgi:predicted patatin/cPLA2 family phospholipase